MRKERKRSFFFPYDPFRSLPPSFIIILSLSSFLSFSPPFSHSHSFSLSFSQLFLTPSHTHDTRIASNDWDKSNHDRFDYVDEESVFYLKEKNEKRIIRRDFEVKRKKRQKRSQTASIVFPVFSRHTGKRETFESLGRDKRALSSVSRFLKTKIYFMPNSKAKRVRIYARK